MNEESDNELARLRELNAQMVASLNRARQLAGIAADFDFGLNGKIEIDGEWVTCRSLSCEFAQMIAKATAV